MKTNNIGICLLLVCSLFVTINANAFDGQMLQQAYQQGLTKYDTMQDFRSEDPIRRDEYAKMLDNFSDILRITADPIKPCQFSDLETADSSLISYPRRVCQKGLMHGTSEQIFHYDRNISMEEVITTLIRTIETPEILNELQGISTQSSLWSTPYLEHWKSLGFPSLDISKNPASRAEVVETMLQVLAKKQSNKKALGNNEQISGKKTESIPEKTDMIGVKVSFKTLNYIDTHYPDLRIELKDEPKQLGSGAIVGTGISEKPQFFIKAFHTGTTLSTQELQNIKSGGLSLDLLAKIS